MLAVKTRQKLNDNISFNSIENYLKTINCGLLFYGKNDNEDCIIDVIGQRGYSKTVSAFTYKSREINIIFINLDNELTCEEKLFLLLHELGHILLKHKSINGILAYGLDECEADADYFAELLTQKTIKYKYEKSRDKIITIYNFVNSNVNIHL
jgi:Predicted Zn peptidase